MSAYERKGSTYYVQLLNAEDEINRLKAECLSASQTLEQFLNLGPLDVTGFVRAALAVHDRLELLGTGQDTEEQCSCSENRGLAGCVCVPCGCADITAEEES